MKIFFILSYLSFSFCAYAEPWAYKQDIMISDISTQDAKDTTVANKVNMPKQEIMPDYITVPVPKASLKRGTIIQNSDLEYIDILPEKLFSTAATDINQLEGFQVRRPLFKKKVIDLQKIGHIITVKRNQDVSIVFNKGGLFMNVTGRALQSGGVGDVIKVMNAQSKKIIDGRITTTGDVDVSL